MAIPGFQRMMLPVLEFCQTDKPITTSELSAMVADHFNLTEEDRSLTIAPGRLRYKNRVAWAVGHLSDAGLLEKISDGEYRITDAGKNVLDTRPKKVDLKFLARFPSWLESRRPHSVKPSEEASFSSRIGDEDIPPNELLEKAYQTLRKSLAQDLLEKVRQASPEFFERLVVDLLLRMGYGGSRPDAGSITRRGADGGIDGTIKEDKLGLDVIYLQAKRWSSTVGSPEVREFAGSLEAHRAKKGVFITTSQFSPDAKTFVAQIGKTIVLIDGQQLCEMMIDHDVGVSVGELYAVKRIDSDYFREE